jgi:hypothetical protein
MRLIVSSNTMPAMTAASFFRPCLRYSARRSRGHYLAVQHADGGRIAPDPTPLVRMATARNRESSWI